MSQSLALPRVLAEASGRSRAAWSVGAALLLHGALLGLALRQEPSLAPLVSVTEVELMKPREPPPPSPPPSPPPTSEAKPEPPAAQPRPARRAAPAKAPSAPTPAPASAAPLRTVADDAPSPDEPVRFVTDPNGSAFGYGVVARGGSALAGQSAAVLPAASEPATGVRSGQPVLSRPPMLGESDPCRGFFPARAQVDRGEVALQVKVEQDGRVQRVSVVRESPLGHGFGFAARDCLLSKRFTPALDKAGREVAVVSPVTVRFSR